MPKTALKGIYSVHALTCWSNGKQCHWKTTEVWVTETKAPLFLLTFSRRTVENNTNSRDSSLNVVVSLAPHTSYPPDVRRSRVVNPPWIVNFLLLLYSLNQIFFFTCLKTSITIPTRQQISLFTLTATPLPVCLPAREWCFLTAEPDLEQWNKCVVLFLLLLDSFIDSLITQLLFSNSKWEHTD